MCVCVCALYPYCGCKIAEEKGEWNLMYVCVLKKLKCSQRGTIALKEAYFIDCHTFQKCHALMPNKNAWHATSTDVENVTRSLAGAWKEQQNANNCWIKAPKTAQKRFNPAFLWLLQVILFGPYILYTWTHYHGTPEYTHSFHLSSYTRI